MPVGHEGRMQLVLDNRSVELRRRVGANAWVVLEELLLGAAIDGPQRATCRATVRALADRTGLSKDTVARSLQRLRRADALTIEPERHDDSGRFVSVRYVVDLARLPVALLVADVPAVAPGRSTRRVVVGEQLSMLG